LVDMLVIQAEKILMCAQRPSEFQPPTGGAAQQPHYLDAAALDRPTDACRLVMALLEEAGRAAREALDGGNLASLLLELGGRMHATWLNHMQQFTFSPAGALRWRSDVAGYTSVLRGWAPPLLPPLEARMASLAALCGVLLVEPEQLLPLVNGSLRLDHREAIKYVRLRQDFSTARVQGRSLQQVFGGGDAVPGGQQAGGGGGGGGGRR
ncbi:hypothetical protein Agub_g9837, partial [Astrephomene gubernaculifera]